MPFFGRASSVLVVALASLVSLVFSPGCGGSTSGKGASNLDEREAGVGVDCAAHPACSLDTPCTAGDCLTVPGCGSPLCIDTKTACHLSCGSAECMVLESYPGQIRCEGRTRPASPDPDAPVSSLTCDGLLDRIDAEIDDLRTCSSAAECGKTLGFGSCGCTRNTVLRNDADTKGIDLLIAEHQRKGCAGRGSTCDCPEADGFACLEGRCSWNYTGP